MDRPVLSNSTFVSLIRCTLTDLVWDVCLESCDFLLGILTLLFIHNNQIVWNDQTVVLIIHFNGNSFTLYRKKKPKVVRK